MPGLGASDEEGNALTTLSTKHPRSALLNLSLTCKGFTEIALDILWRDLDSLRPLLDCLPVDVIEEGNGTIGVDRPLGLEELVIFQKYARRVQSVGFQVRDQSERDPIPHILSNFPCEEGKGLLPNLKTIVWYADDDESISFLRYLAPRTLVSLYLTGTSWPQRKVSLVSFLHKHFPNLQTFLCAGHPPEATHRISEFICNAETLSVVCIGALNEKAMKHLMESTVLRTLSVFLPNHDDWDMVAGKFLPSLTLFRIHGAQPSKVAEYLVNIRLSPRQVRIEFKNLTTGISFAQSLKDLVVSFNKGRLLALEFAVNNLPQIRPSLKLPADALDPLFRFRNLTCLKLENFFTPYLNDEKVIQMAKNWPHLKELRIGTGLDWNTEAGTLVRSRITLYGVAYIAQHCQHLRVLGLVFDSLAPLTTNIPQDWRNSRIRVFAVGGSTCSIESVALVANLVAQLFPRLHTISSLEEETKSPPPGSRREAWNVVQSISKRFVEMQETVRQKAMREAREEVYKELERSGLGHNFSGAFQGQIREKKEEPGEASLVVDDEQSWGE